MRKSHSTKKALFAGQNRLTEWIEPLVTSALLNAESLEAACDDMDETTDNIVDNNNDNDNNNNNDNNNDNNNKGEMDDNNDDDIESMENIEIPENTENTENGTEDKTLSNSEDENIKIVQVVRIGRPSLNHNNRKTGGTPCGAPSANHANTSLPPFPLDDADADLMDEMKSVPTSLLISDGQTTILAILSPSTRQSLYQLACDPSLDACQKNIISRGCVINISSWKLHVLLPVPNRQSPTDDVSAAAERAKSKTSLDGKGTTRMGCSSSNCDDDTTDTTSLNENLMADEIHFNSYSSRLQLLNVDPLLHDHEKLLHHRHHRYGTSLHNDNSFAPEYVVTLLIDTDCIAPSMGKSPIEIVGGHGLSIAGRPTYIMDTIDVRRAVMDYTVHEFQSLIVKDSKLPLSNGMSCDCEKDNYLDAISNRKRPDSNDDQCPQEPKRYRQLTPSDLHTDQSSAREPSTVARTVTMTTSEFQSSNSNHCPCEKADCDLPLGDVEAFLIATQSSRPTLFELTDITDVATPSLHTSPNNIPTTTAEAKLPLGNLSDGWDDGSEGDRARMHFFDKIVKASMEETMPTGELTTGGGTIRCASDDDKPSQVVVRFVPDVSDNSDSSTNIHVTSAACMGPTPNDDQLNPGRKKILDRSVSMDTFAEIEEVFSDEYDDDDDCSVDVDSEDTNEHEDYKNSHDDTNLGIGNMLVFEDGQDDIGEHNQGGNLDTSCIASAAIKLSISDDSDNSDNIYNSEKDKVTEGFSYDSDDLEPLDSQPIHPVVKKKRMTLIGEDVDHNNFTADGTHAELDGCDVDVLSDDDISIDVCQGNILDADESTRRFHDVLENYEELASNLQMGRCTITTIMTDDEVNASDCEEPLHLPLTQDDRIGENSRGTIATNVNLVSPTVRKCVVHKEIDKNDGTYRNTRL